MTYDDNNIFAKILRGEIPCQKVYETERVLAFMDVMPQAPGHVLVIPKVRARNILDVSSDDLAHLIKEVQVIAKATKQAFGPTASMSSSSTKAQPDKRFSTYTFTSSPVMKGSRCSTMPMLSRRDSIL